MAEVSVSLLGECRIFPGTGDPPKRLGQKEWGLLAVLALSSGIPIQRETLAALLWSDRGERHARDSLKHALARLRTALQQVPDCIAADRQTVRLDPTAIVTDVAAFEQLCGQPSDAAAERALELYKGDLLAGSTVRDPAFEDWLETERRRLRKLAEDTAERVINEATRREDPDRAMTAATRLQELDPLREDACRTIMSSLARSGDRNGALRQFQEFRDRLMAELGVAPEPETLAIHDEIRGATLRQTDPEILPDMPSRPSVAVLAFDVPGNDPEQLYFADGIVEEIIAALSRVRWLFVISRSSSFAWRGEQADVTEIGRTLGVRYVLSGSVRRAADRLRIAGRLIDASDGALLWAETFEGGVEGVFELQDQVTSRVVGAVAPRLEEAEIARAKRKPTDRLDAYHSYLRGLSALHLWRREANLEAIAWFQQATWQDPEFAAAFGLESRCYSQQKACGWVTDHDAVVDAARRAAECAVEFGQDDALALSTAGIGLAFVANRLSYGAELIARSLELNPNLASAWLFSGWVNAWLGEPEIALDHIARAMRLNPRDPETAMMYAANGYAHFVAGDYAEAARWAAKSARNRPNYLIAWCILAASRAFLGESTEASRMVAQITELDPHMRISNLLAHYPIKRDIDRARWTEGMTLAGLQA